MYRGQGQAHARSEWCERNSYNEGFAELVKRMTEPG